MSGTEHILEGLRNIAIELDYTFDQMLRAEERELIASTDRAGLAVMKSIEED